MVDEMKVALERAKSVLSRAERIESAISAEVAKLPQLIEDRLESERAFRRLECEAATGCVAPGMAGARKAYEAAVSALRSVTASAGAFRSLRGENGPELAAAYDELQAQIPGHAQRIVDAFTCEWTEAVAQFSVMLGRRAEIEKLLGVSMVLPEPTAVVGSNHLGADATEPYELLREIEAALKVISRMHSTLNAPENVRIHATPGSLPAYDRDAVYVLRGGLAERFGPRGSKVVDASFERGRLEALVIGGDVKPFHEATDPGTSAALTKLKAIERESKERQERAEQEEALKRAGFVSGSRRLDLEKLNTPFDDSDRRAQKEAQLQTSYHPSDGEGVVVGSRP